MQLPQIATPKLLNSASAAAAADKLDSADAARDAIRLLEFAASPVPATSAANAAFLARPAPRPAVLGSGAPISGQCAAPAIVARSMADGAASPASNATSDTRAPVPDKPQELSLIHI